MFTMQDCVCFQSTLALRYEPNVLFSSIAMATLSHFTQRTFLAVSRIFFSKLQFSRYLYIHITYVYYTCSSK